MRRQLSTYLSWVQSMQAACSAAARRGPVDNWRRRVMLVSLRDLLEDQHVDPDYHTDIMQFACELVGEHLPEPSKLKKLLAENPRQRW
jgi:hypothetical protein